MGYLTVFRELEKKNNPQGRELLKMAERLLIRVNGMKVRKNAHSAC